MEHVITVLSKECETPEVVEAKAKELVDKMLAVYNGEEPKTEKKEQEEKKQEEEEKKQEENKE